jgi:hypothetical protein
MDQKYLQNHQDAREEDFVENARTFLKQIIRAECPDHGDMEKTIKTIANRNGVSFGKLWTLRYRPPKTVSVAMYCKLYNEHQRIEPARPNT